MRIRKPKHQVQDKAKITSDEQKTLRTYKALKIGQMESVGLVDGQEYYWMRLCGFACIPTYIRITEEEFNTFEEWTKYPYSDQFWEIINRSEEFDIHEVYEKKS